MIWYGVSRGLDDIRRPARQRAELSSGSATRKARNPADKTARQPARSGARLYARRGRGLRSDRRRPGDRRRFDRSRQPGRRGVQRQRRARARQYRPARRQTGDGRQGGVVQEIRRHRRVRHRDRGARGRPHGRGHRRTGADLRRHQSRGHQGARMLRGGGEAEGAHAHPGLPRRPARHRHHRRRRRAERAVARQQADRRGQDRCFGRRRRRDRLSQSARFAWRQAGEHLGHRHRGAGLCRPRRSDGPLEGGLRPERPTSERWAR